MVLGLCVLGTALGIALFADWLAPVSPWRSVDDPFQPPSAAHPMGTDDLGRDVMAGSIHGTRTSMLIGLGAAGLSSAIGIVLGALAGYAGGLLDDAIMRLTEFFQVLPRFFLALVAVALFQPGIVTITLVLGLTAWPLTARILRAQVLAERERDYVIAARALGAGPVSILWRHLLPNTLAPVVIQVSLLVGQVILTEASLAFLGLGDPNHISWGYMLRNAQQFLRLAWWMPLFPGMAVALTVFGFSLLGDGLNNRWYGQS